MRTRQLEAQRRPLVKAKEYILQPGSLYCMPDLSNLYQELILDHSRKPRHFYKMIHANRQAEGFNPLCGDSLTLYLHLDKGIIQDVSFVGTGCAISMASGSLMVECLRGKTKSEAHELFQTFHHLVTSSQEISLEAKKSLGKLIALAGVREFSSRVKCATLAWHALRAALEKTTQPVSTEEDLC